MLLCDTTTHSFMHLAEIAEETFSWITLINSKLQEDKSADI